MKRIKMGTITTKHEKEKNMQMNDTVKLLRECDSGVRMGIESIGQVIGSVSSSRMKARLEASLNEHESISEKIETMLADMGDDGKKPNPIAKGMSWLKTGMKLTMDKSDSTIADLMTDGCNMGVKSLSKYMNEYAGANNDSREIAESIIKTEERLAHEMRDYL